MKIKIITVGKVRENYIIAGMNEYLKRLKPHYNIEIIELKEDSSIETKLLKYQNAYLLDPDGKQINSISFSNLVKNEFVEIAFIIGDAYGFSDKFKKNYKKLSLSKMTFTHEMARLLLIEQIYRSFMIIHNKPYHK